MAPVLQCPDCATRHPLADYADRASFRCTGCGRVLKVPEQHRRMPAPAAATTAGRAEAAHGRAPRPDATRSDVARAAPEPTPTRASVPPSDLQPSPEPAVEIGRIALWWRLGLWVVAVPLGFLLVFGVARLLGLFTSDQLEDALLDSGWNRFWPVARLLPLVALVTAAIVHFSVYALARRRLRQPVAPSRSRARVDARRGS